jgi:hypothetical protein
LLKQNYCRDIQHVLSNFNGEKKLSPELVHLKNYISDKNSYNILHRKKININADRYEVVYIIEDKTKQ